jgi:hypothetical protein
VALPEDIVPLDYSKVPAAAAAWCYKGNVTDDDINEHSIGWSAVYNRVVIPIYKTGILPTKNVANLAGWIGRDVFYDYDKSTGAKYIIRKINMDDRIYFTINKDSDKLVIVEDVLSAIRVSREKQVNTLALLNTHIPPELMQELRRYHLHVWLDSNVYAKSIRFVRQCIALGGRASVIRTDLDPKDVDQKELELTF